MVPDSVPVLTAGELADLRSAPYPEVAAAVLTRFAPDLDNADLARAAETAYGPDRFDHPNVVSLRPLGDGLVLCGLSNGPTLAFKDIALQLLGQLFEHVLAQQGGGSTSSARRRATRARAAEHAMRGSARRRRVHAVAARAHEPVPGGADVLADDANIHNLAVEGTFDECQDLVKAVNADAAFKARHAIGAVNSINWARVAAQVVYYFTRLLRGDARQRRAGRLRRAPGQLRQHLSPATSRESMGLPIRRLILATNENDVLDEFFRTGRYRPRRREDVHATSSPSMDISKASNFERYVFDMRRTAIARRERWRNASAATAASTSGTPLEAACAHGFVVRPQHARRPYRDHPRRRRALRASSSTRTPPMALKVAALSSRTGCR